ncbi:2924_t:CDS:2 [Ambispora gerdemannii]|uniref:2924_t:CDS:1 n=1 Tax=Ambispora gerdemannii TaxID=144530 RepID=A0A9N8V1Q0_9GLOM|nr:2924_t:CDS:2 [Ambispora gerdemannii]
MEVLQILCFFRLNENTFQQPNNDTSSSSSAQQPVTVTSTQTPTPSSADDDNNNSPKIVTVTSTSTFETPEATKGAGAQSTAGAKSSSSGGNTSKTLIISGSVVGGIVVLAGVGLLIFRFGKSKRDWDDEGEVVLGGRAGYTGGDPFKSTLDQYHRNR